MHQETSNNIYSRISDMAKVELAYILSQTNLPTKISLMADFQYRTGKCIEDCIRDRNDMCPILDEINEYAKAEMQDLYRNNPDLFDMLEIAKPKI